MFSVLDERRTDEKSPVSSEISVFTYLASLYVSGSQYMMLQDIEGCELRVSKVVHITLVACQLRVLIAWLGS